jgi:site-specific recombinase XerD
MAKIFHKWACPSPKCRRWYRTPGTCKCGAELIERSEYSVDYRDGDAKRRIEDLDTTSKRVAERELAIRIGEASKGKSRPQRRTLVSICQEYMETKSIHNADGGRRDGHSFQHVLEHFKTRTLENISQREIQSYVNARRKKKAAAGTIEKEVGLIKRVWKYARTNKMVHHFPFEEIKIPGKKTAAMRPISVKQEEALWEALPASSLPYYKFVAYTGCRMSEALNLTWDDIDWQEKVAWVSSGKNRHGEVELQPVFLGKKALAILKDLHHRKLSDTWVFINPVTGEPYKNPKNTLRRAIKKLGLPMRSVHDLRHLFGSRLVESGIDNVTASILMRHKDIRMMRRYTHLSSGHLRKTLDKAQKKD